MIYKVFFLVVVIALLVSSCGYDPKAYHLTNDGVTTTISAEQYGRCLSEPGQLGKIRVSCVKGRFTVYDVMVDKFEVVWE